MVEKKAITTKKEEAIIVKEEQSVDMFITQALSSGASVETMERLFALKKEVRKEQAKEGFVSAMAKFQALCPVIEKTKKVMDKNNTLRYMFAPLDSIITQIKKPLGENNLFYSFDEEKDATHVTAICTVTHSLGHSQTSSFKVEIGTEAYMNDAQKYGARMTFAKRYALCNALGIVTGDEDTDATTTKKQEPKSVKSKISLALKKLGEDNSTKESCETATLKLVNLELIEENFDEILGRLEIIISEQDEN